MRKLRVSIAVASLAALAASARADDEVSLRLPNGAEVVVLPTRGQGAAAVVSRVSVVAAYRVGARDEAKDEAGAAHLVEHLHAKSAVAAEAKEAALRLEAFGETRSDTLHALTWFAATVPEDEVVLPLVLERDRLLSIVPTPDDLRVARARVTAEVLNVEVALVPRAWNALLGLAFGDHGLGRPRVGRQETIEKLDLERLSIWHRQRYRPDTLLVVVAGARDPAATIARVGSALAALPSATGAVPAAPPLPAPAKGPSRKNIEARSLAEREVDVAFRGPDAGDPEEAAFLALAFTLRDSLDRGLKGIARSITVQCDPRSPDPVLLVARALPGARRELSELETRLFAEIGKVRDQGPGDPRLHAARVEAQLVALTGPLDARLERGGKDRAPAVVAQAAVDRAVADPLIRRRPELIERLRKLTGDEVKAAARKWLAAERACVVSVDVKR